MPCLIVAANPVQKTPYPKKGTLSSIFTKAEVKKITALSLSIFAISSLHFGASYTKAAKIAGAIGMGKGALDYFAPLSEEMRTAHVLTKDLSLDLPEEIFGGTFVEESKEYLGSIKQAVQSAWTAPKKAYFFALWGGFFVKGTLSEYRRHSQIMTLMEALDSKGSFGSVGNTIDRRLEDLSSFFRQLENKLNGSSRFFLSDFMAALTESGFPSEEGKKIFSEILNRGIQSEEISDKARSEVFSSMVTGCFGDPEKRATFFRLLGQNVARELSRVIVAGQRDGLREILLEDAGVRILKILIDKCAQTNRYSKTTLGGFLEEMIANPEASNELTVAWIAELECFFVNEKSNFFDLFRESTLAQNALFEHFFVSINPEKKGLEIPQGFFGKMKQAIEEEKANLKVFSEEWKTISDSQAKICLGVLLVFLGGMGIFYWGRRILMPTYPNGIVQALASQRIQRAASLFLVAPMAEEILFRVGLTESLVQVLSKTTHMEATKVKVVSVAVETAAYATFFMLSVNGLYGPFGKGLLTKSVAWISGASFALASRSSYEFFTIQGMKGASERPAWKKGVQVRYSKWAQYLLATGLFRGVPSLIRLARG